MSVKHKSTKASSTTLSSNFVIQLQNQVNRIQEIIDNPPLVGSYLDSLHDIHDGILMMIDSYKTISINSVKKQIIDSIDMSEYRTRLISDLKSKTNKTKNKNLTTGVKSKLPTVNTNNNFTEFKLINKIPDIYYESTDYFDELESYVDLGMNRENLSNTDKIMIKNYYDMKFQIEDLYKETIESVQKFEQKVCDIVLDINMKLKPILDMIYEEHLQLCIDCENDKSKPKISQQKYFKDRLTEIL